MKIKQLIKNSILGAMMLPAIMLSGCTEPNKPNKPQEEKDPAKAGIGVIIENVTIDGVPVSADDLRAVGRKDIVRFEEGVTHDESLIELQWKEVTKGKPMLIWIHAKPNLYLKDFKYRYRQTDPYETNVLNLTTYGSDVPLKNLSEKNGPQSIDTEPVIDGDNNVYVTLEYGKIGPDYDLLVSFRTDAETASYRKQVGEQGQWSGVNSALKGIWLTNTVVLENLSDKPISIKSMDVEMRVNDAFTLEHVTLYGDRFIKDRTPIRDTTFGVRLGANPPFIVLAPHEKQTITFAIDFTKPIEKTKHGYNLYKAINTGEIRGYNPNQGIDENAYYDYFQTHFLFHGRMYGMGLSASTPYLTGIGMVDFYFEKQGPRTLLNETGNIKGDGHYTISLSPEAIAKHGQIYLTDQTN